MDSEFINLVLGQQKSMELLAQARSSGKLHHGWIFTGLSGVGKSKAAYAFARELLAESWQSPVLEYDTKPNSLFAEIDETSSQSVKIVT